MAKKVSVCKTLKMIFEKSEAAGDNEEDEFSEFKDHISGTSESDSEFQDEDAIDLEQNNLVSSQPIKRQEVDEYVKNSEIE